MTLFECVCGWVRSVCEKCVSVHMFLHAWEMTQPEYGRKIGVVRHANNIKDSVQETKTCLRIIYILKKKTV